CTVVNQFGQCTGVGTTTGFGNTGCLSVVNGVCIGSSILSTTASDVNFDFTVTLSPASTQTVQVDWTTADGSAVSGTDYQAGSGTLTFNPGDTTKTITVRAFSRNFNDISSRDFLVRLSNPRNASISDGEGRGRIERTGGSTCGSIVNGVCTNTGIGVGIGNCGFGFFWNGFQCVSSTGTTGTGGVNILDNANCVEGGICGFTINTGTQTSTAITGTYSTSNGSAVGVSVCGTGPSSDYVVVSNGTWTIPAFSSSSSGANVQVCADSTVEGDENFLVNITITSGNAVVTRGTATGTIRANST